MVFASFPFSRPIFCLKEEKPIFVFAATPIGGRRGGALDSNAYAEVQSHCTLGAASVNDYVGNRFELGTIETLISQPQHEGVVAVAVSSAKRDLKDGAGGPSGSASRGREKFSLKIYL